MNKYSISVKFYPKESAEKKGTCPIYCRIVVNRKKAEFNTQERTSMKKWDEEKERVRGNPEANAILSGIEANVRTTHSLLIMNNKPVTAALLRDTVTDRSKVITGLLDYYTRFQSEIEELKDEFSQSTIKKYKTIKIHLEEYLKTKHISSINMNEFDMKRFSEFEYYLKTIAKVNTNTATKYLKQLKAVFNRAARFGIIDKVAFHGFKFKYEQTDRGFLTKEEIEALEIFEAPNESLGKVKDIFLFSVYTGLRFSDVSSLKENNIRVDREKNVWLEFTMNKTDKHISLPLINKAKDLLKKYKVEKEITGRLLPAISNQKINAYLKVLGDLAGLDKTLTYHMARHTFATTITLSNEVPIEVVSKMLGHSRLATTQIYAKVTSDYLLKTTKQLNKKVK